MTPGLAPFDPPTNDAVSVATDGESVSRLSWTITLAAPFLSGTVVGDTSPHDDASFTVPPNPLAGAPLPSSACSVTANGWCSITSSLPSAGCPSNVTLNEHAAAASFFTHSPQVQ